VKLLLEAKADPEPKTKVISLLENGYTVYCSKQTVFIQSVFMQTDSPLMANIAYREKQAIIGLIYTTASLHLKVGMVSFSILWCGLKYCIIYLH